MSTPRGQQPLAPLCMHNYPVNVCHLCAEAVAAETTGTTKSRNPFRALFRRGSAAPAAETDRVAEVAAVAATTQGTEETATAETAP
jgi:hypothetical protein